MRSFFGKPLIPIVLIICTLALGAGVFMSQKKSVPLPQTSKIVEKKDNPFPLYEIIGRSIEGRAIESYSYGNGEKHLLFVGGMHGGYEWNSVLLAYEAMDYLEKNSSTIPANLTITIIPSLNPDGVYKVIGKVGRFALTDAPTDETITAQGRFNAREVDLNRNFDCKWQPKSMWRKKVVSAGTAPFSEPETRALQEFVTKERPRAVIFWHSKSNAVYASQCEKGILPETLNIMNAYARASGYGAVESFDSYEVTGDAEGWLASIDIPAITVELKTHATIEWEENLAGIKALFAYYQ